MKTSIVCALLLKLICGTVSAQQATTPADTVICTVAHIDFMPNHTQTVTVLEAYVARESHDPGVTHVELLQSITAPNHFTLLETFRDKAAYDGHIEAGYTRNFRAGIAPALGSPYDERLFRPHPVF